MTQEAKVLLGIVVVSVIMVVGAAFFFSANDPAAAEVKAVSADILVKADSQKITNEDAKVTIVEFGDYECPACGLAHPVVEQILNEYPGKVNFVFRHFPLPMHKNAIKAAEVAEAAGEQGKYFQMHNLLYQKQEEWSESSELMNLFTGYAQELGMDVEKFKQSVESGKHFQKIMSDKNDANSIGINSTPTFYVNGEKLNGFAPEKFKEKIDKVYSGQ